MNKCKMSVPSLLMAILLFGLLFCSQLEKTGSVADAAYEDDGVSVTEAAYENVGSEGNVQADEDETVLKIVIGYKINFEYLSDGTILNPSITVRDENGDGIDFSKKYNPAHQAYEIRFDYQGVADAVYRAGAADGSVAAAAYFDNTRFKVIVSAPGYVTQEKEVQVSRDPADPGDPNYYGSDVFDLQATPAYRLGREVTRRADELLNFAGAEGVLCITTAGSVHYQGNTSEDVLEGILNQAYRLITYGQGNLLMLRKTQVDQVDFAFVVKKGNDLRLAYFKNGSLSPEYVGTISQNMSSGNWAAVSSKLGDNTFPVASLANAWAIGLSPDILREAAFHGHVCLGTISGYAMIETLFKYYPPGALGSDKEATSYLVLGVPGGSDDDVLVYAMDNTPGKRAYVGVATTDDKSMAGFIRWNSKAKKGTLIIMKFDEQALARQFKEETGVTIVEDTLTELKFNAWLVDKLKSSPESLVIIVKALDGLTEEQCNYLNGGTGSDTVQDAHGLDMDYINSLDLPEAAPDNKTYSKGDLTPQQLKQIGTDAAMEAKELFSAEMGIQLEKDDPNILVLTSAGYARLGGQATDMTWDGIYDVLGSRINRTTLLPVHSALWDKLWFSFVLKQKIAPEMVGKKGSTGKFSFVIQEDDSSLYALYMYYDPDSKQMTVTKDVYGKTIHDIGPACNASQVSPLFGGKWNNVNTIANAWAYDPPYDMLMVYLFHNHVCPGVSPSYLITDYIFQNYPLGKDEKYIFVTTTDYCKDDGLLYLLGISPGAGTYYNARLKDTKSPTVDGGSMEGILIKWNEKIQLGTAVIITFKWPQFATGENALKGYISLYRGESPAGLVYAPVVVKEAEKLITRGELNTILAGASGSGNALQFVMGLPDRSLSDLIPAPVPSEQRSKGGSSKSAPVESTLVPTLTPTPAEAAPPAAPAPATTPEQSESEEVQPQVEAAPSSGPAASPAMETVPAAPPAAGPVPVSGATPGLEPGTVAQAAPAAEASPGESTERAYEVEKEQRQAAVIPAYIPVGAVLGVVALVALGAAGFFFRRFKGM